MRICVWPFLGRMMPLAVGGLVLLGLAGRVEAGGGLVTIRDGLERLIGVGGGLADDDGPRWNLLPREVNLRSEIQELRVNFVQQGNRNACAAFSATGTLELQARRLGYDIDLSEQYLLWACQEVGADPGRGLAVEEIEEALTRHGICLEEQMPYKSTTDIIDPTPAARAGAERVPPIRVEQVVPYDGVPGLSRSEIYAICRALSRFEPLCFSMFWPVDQLRMDKGHVIADGPVDTPHMVMLTGYELDGGAPGGGYFHLRNSWGLGWGDFGYARLPFAMAERHGVAAVRFVFDYAALGGTSGGARAEGAVDATGLHRYAVGQAAVYLAAGLLGFTLPVVLLGGRRKWPPGVLAYLLLLAPLVMVMLLVLNALVVQLLLGRIALGWVLGGCLFLLAIISLRLTSRHFHAGVFPALGILLVGGTLAVVLFVLGARWMPWPDYQEWRREFRHVPFGSQVLLLLAEPDVRSAGLARIRARREAGDSSLAGERVWIRDWRRELESERPLIRADNERVRSYFQRRLDAHARHARAVQSAGEGRDPQPPPALRREFRSLAGAFVRPSGP